MKNIFLNIKCWGKVSLVILILLSSNKVFSTAFGIMSITNCASGPNYIEYQLVIKNNSNAGEVLYLNTPAPMRLNCAAGIVPAGTNTYSFQYISGSCDSRLSPLYTTLGTTYNLSYTASSRLMQSTFSNAILGNSASAVNCPLNPGDSIVVGKFRLTITNTNFVAGQNVGLTWVTTSGFVAYVGTATSATAFNATNANRTLSVPCSMSIPSSCSVTTSMSSTPVSCLGASDGTASVAATGSAPFTYSWSNGGTGSSITGLSAGKYVVTVTGTGGCTKSDSVTLAAGSAPTDNAVSANACSSYVWAVNGVNYTQSGSYTYTASCVNNILNLTIKSPTSSSSSESACVSYTWNETGLTYTTSGTYYAYPSYAYPSDTTVSYSSLSDFTNAVAAAGYSLSVTETFSGNLSSGNFGAGTSDWAASSVGGLYGCYTPTPSISTFSPDTLFFTFSPGVTAVGAEVFLSDINCSVQPGDVVILLSDSTRVTVNVSSSSNFIGFVSRDALITGMSIVPPGGGLFVTADNMVVGTGISPPACPRASLLLTIQDTTSSRDTIRACDSYTWPVNGNTYSQSGVYSSVSGCHTNLLDLMITASSSNLTSVSSCDSYTWVVNGNTYSASGSYTSVTGCHTEVLALTIVSSSANYSSVSACNSYTWNSTTYTTSGAKTWTGTNAAGCDSVATLDLIIKSPTSSSSGQSACDSYTWNGVAYTTSGIKTWTGTNAEGCDSVATLNLSITASTTTPSAVSACDSYYWVASGNTYTQSGIYSKVTGCHTAILDLTITVSSTNPSTQTASDSYTWSANGTTYYQSGTYTSVNGCITNILTLTVVSGCKIATGSYTGNGLDNRTISGLGFSPALVIIKSDTITYKAQIRTSGMPSGLSKPMTGVYPVYTGRIKDFNSDGFVIGNNSDVNQSGKVYYWTALGGSSLITGTYLGTGVDDRNITGVGFSPSLVMLMPADGERISWRSSTFMGTASSSFEKDFNMASTITALGADGFTVGSNPRANKLNARYYYAAFKPGNNVLATGKYTGNSIAGRFISVPGIDIRFMFLKPENLVNACQKSSAMPANSSIEFSGAKANDSRIYNMGNNGFSLGKQDQVNRLNIVYHYVAFGSCSQQAPARPMAEIKPTEISLSVFPNPAYDNATVAISSPSAGDAYMELIDASGRKISGRKINLLGGENYYGINTTGMRPGLYIIKLTGSSGSQSLKLMVGK